MREVVVREFADWRETSRALLRRQIPPEQVAWREANDPQESLDGLFAPESEPAPIQANAITVPKAFLELAHQTSCYRDPARWSLLYRILWRLTHGEHDLLKIEVDPDIRQAMLMEKAIARDIHKMHAFVRFRKVEDVEGERFVAWHRPDHLIVREAAPFFARRFGAMRWAILTPDLSAYWENGKLEYGPGVPQSEAPSEDALEDLWRTYYASIFNPARLRTRAMKAELPVRHWATLPEAQLIPKLTHQAHERAQIMLAQQPSSAAEFVPQGFHVLHDLKNAAKDCQGCDLYRHATQTVFGEGPPQASIVFVGEQPGDQEDLQGRPFVGPAGQLLNRAMAEAGLDRSQIYMTNAVKHFKFTSNGKRRIHQKPRGAEMSACRPWLEAELTLIRPKLIVALGATAAQTLLGRDVTISRERGAFQPHRLAEQLLITTHPSAILRMPEPEQQEREFQRLVSDLRLVAEHA